MFLRSSNWLCSGQWEQYLCFSLSAWVTWLGVWSLRETDKSAEGNIGEKLAPVRGTEPNVCCFVLAWLLVAKCCLEFEWQRACWKWALPERLHSVRSKNFTARWCNLKLHWIFWVKALKGRNKIITTVWFNFRQHKLYNKELYADFIAAQIKTLSFLAYIIRIYQVGWIFISLVFNASSF